MSCADPQRDPTFRPYWDPALRSNARNYREFIQKLNDIKYLKYTLLPKEHAGVFSSGSLEGRGFG